MLEPSNELPMDEYVLKQIKSTCEQIREATERQVRAASYPSAAITLDWMSFVVDGRDPYITVYYSGKADTTDRRSEYISCDIEIRIRDGRLEWQPDSSRQISPLASVMQPALRGQTASVLESTTYPEALFWPVSLVAHEAILSQGDRLLDLYLKSLKDFLEPSGSICGRIEKIRYEFWFEKAPRPDYARVRVTFDITGTKVEFFNPGVELDYKAGAFRVLDSIHSGWFGGVEYVGDASSSAMDHAMPEWIEGFSPTGVFQDARLEPPFEWQEHGEALPDGIGRIVHMTQRSHPFLGEHHRKYRIELADGSTKTFTLPTDGGGVSRTDVFLIRMSDRPFIRLKDDRMTDIVIALDSLKLCPPAGIPEGDLVLSFKE